MRQRSLGSAMLDPAVLWAGAVGTATAAFCASILIDTDPRGYGIPSLFYLALILATLAGGRRAALTATPLLTGAYLLGLWAQGATSAELVSAGAIRLAVSLLIGVLVGASVDHNREAASVARQQATIDPLTGVGNRRAVEAAWTRLAGRPFGVLVIDMDGLKALNDACGHTAGDAALRDLAAAIERSVRPEDTVARMGGDEFVVLTGATSRELRSIAARIEEAARHVGLTASIGSAVAPDDGDDLDSLLATADSHMYALKTERRTSRTRPYRPERSHGHASAPAR